MRPWPLPLILLAGCASVAQRREPLRVAVVPLGPGAERLAQDAAQAVERRFVAVAEVRPARPLPKTAYYPPRRRYRAERLLDALRPEPGADRVLGVTARDISTPAHGHPDWGVMGLADLGGKAAVASRHRPRSDAEFRLTVLHEFGHTLGLPHCGNKDCLMRDYDGKTNKGPDFCAACRRRLGPRLR